MHIQTGKTVTVEMPIDIQYRCSACGTANLLTKTISGSAYTGTILGFDLESDLEKQAQNNLLEKYSAITDKKNPERFRTAIFTCKCQNCGHAEPWARMQFPILRTVTVVVLCILIISTVISLFNFSLIGSGSVNPIPFAVLVWSAAAYFGLKAYYNKKCEDLEMQYVALPKECRPTILPHSKERHDAFHSVPVNQTPKNITYDKWICQECGTQNSTQYAQCKKCGKFKNS